MKTHANRVANAVYHQFAPNVRPEFSIAKIHHTESGLLADFCPTKNEKSLQYLVETMADRSGIDIQLRILHTLEDYCKVYHSALFDRTPAGEDLAAYACKNEQEWTQGNGNTYPNNHFDQRLTFIIYFHKYCRWIRQW